MAAEDRLHGSGGEMQMDPAGGSALVTVASINAYDIDLAKDQAKVTCFRDTNQVYVEGLPDIKGTYKGCYDPAEGLVIFGVIFGTVKPTLRFLPNYLTPLVYFGGKGNVSGKISVDASGAITIGGGFTAAGPWTLPS